MSHRFGDLLTQYLHRKHGLSQAKLAAGILQAPSVVSDMSHGKRLSGAQARLRVTAIIDWLQQQGALTTLDDANALLNAAGMSPLQEGDTDEALLIQRILPQADKEQGPSLDAAPATQRAPSAMPRDNLPPPLTPFIGRAEQVDHLVQQLQARRLLTLTGAGGVGKTRLALEVAERMRTEFSDGIWFVDLAPLTHANSALQRILDLWHVPEQPGHLLLGTLTAYLQTRELLLVLDNCEHLIDACTELVEAILQNCPQVSLLATSREALNIRAEKPWRVPSLTYPRAHSDRDNLPASKALPQPPDDLLRFEAVALFVERARIHKSGFTLTAENAPAVAHICRRLDGIPLALEMAAARVNVFTVEELATRLGGAFDARFQLLTSGARTAPFRHQTLRAMLEWSYALLTPAEQSLLTHLSVFSGGWTALAAEEVLNADLEQLAQLVNKSLVVADQQGGQTRYRLLETVRHLALEQISGNEQEQRRVQRQHSRYYLRLLAEEENRLQSQQQQIALDTLRVEFANIRAAWCWAVDHHEFALLAPAVHTLFLYCEVRGHFREGANLLAGAATELTTAAATTATEVPILRSVLGQVLARLGACEVMVDYRTSGVDHLQQALRHVTTDWERAFALAYLGIATVARGERAAGRAALEESLALSRQCGDPDLTAQVLYSLATALETVAEIQACEEILAHWRKKGRPDRVAEVLNFVAWQRCCLGDYETAISYWQETMEIGRALDMQHAIAWALDFTGWAAWCQGDLPAARQYLQEALDLYQSLGMTSMVAMTQAEQAIVLRSSGDVEQAVTTALQAVGIARTTDDQIMLILTLNYLGAVLIGAGDAVPARAALVEAIQRALAAQFPWCLMTAFYYFAELLVLESSANNRSDALEQKALAVMLLTRVCTYGEAWHGGAWQIFKDKATQLQADIEGALPTEMRATAIARGQRCSPEEIVSTFLSIETA